MITLTAVLLAGGESRRMGRDKATIVFGGQPLWQRQLELLRDLRPEKIFVSARTKPLWLPDDVELLFDDPPFRGPLGGLTKAIEQIQTSHLIAVAVDMPFMTSEELRFLCSLAIAGRGLVPVINERAEPLAAVYSREAAPGFAAALAGDDFCLQTLIRHLARAGMVQLWDVPAEARGFYRSLNEPGDLPLEG